MEGNDNLSCKLLCMACLCVGRSLHEITDSKLKQYYFYILDEMSQKDMLSQCPIVCWECEALLKKTMSFMKQVRDCYSTLQSYSIKSLDECLLTGVTRPPRLKVTSNKPITILPGSECNDKQEVQIIDIKDEVRNLWDDVIDLDIEESTNVQDWTMSDCLDNIVVEVDLNTGVQNIVTKKRTENRRKSQRGRKRRVCPEMQSESSLSSEVTPYEIVNNNTKDQPHLDNLENTDITSGSNEGIDKHMEEEDEWSHVKVNGENRDCFQWTISDSRSSSESVSEVSTSDSQSFTDDTEKHTLWKNSVMLVYHRLCGHKHASVFRRAVPEERAPWYRAVVRRPMDLATIRTNIRTGRIRTTAEFHRDVLLMLSNALMYNSSDNRIHAMAKDMHEEVKSQLDILQAAQAQTEPQAPQRRKRKGLEYITENSRSVSKSPHTSFNILESNCKY